MTKAPPLASYGRKMQLKEELNEKEREREREKNHS